MKTALRSTLNQFHSLLVFLGLAFGMPVANAEEAVKAVAADAKASLSAVVDEGKALLEVQVLPPAGTKLNYLGPWKLQLEPSGFVTKNGKNILGKTEFDQQNQKFSIPVNLTETHSSSKGKLGGKYALTYFLCDKEEKWCTRKTAEGPITSK